MLSRHAAHSDRLAVCADDRFDHRVSACLAGRIVGRYRCALRSQCFRNGYTDPPRSAANDGDLVSKLAHDHCLDAIDTEGGSGTHEFGSMLRPRNLVDWIDRIKGLKTN